MTDTQNLTTDGVTKVAVKSLDVAVGEGFGQGFFGSCKDVKFGATNGYAMDLLGGGAKNYLAFLNYMGQERALGSPFQINFPPPSEFISPPLTIQSLEPFSSRSSAGTKVDNSTAIPFDDAPLVCSSPELNARCACPDCPSVCATLPPILSPAERAAKTCKVGQMSCFSFFLVIVYALVLVGFVLGLGLQEFWKRGQKVESEEETGTWTTLRRRLSWRGPSNTGYDRVPMEDPVFPRDSEDSSSRPSGARPSSNGRTTNSLIGATSTATFEEDNLRSDRRAPSGSSGVSPEASLSRSSRSRLSGGASLLDPSSDPSNPFLQPRTYALNTFLSSAFYRLGLFCARRPYLTLAIGFAVCGIINSGWSRFEIEKDPVRLWVARGSESEVAKEEFDESFGPFYRTEQVFVSLAPELRRVEGEEEGEWNATIRASADWQVIDAPVLNWERLQWWASIEQQIRELRSYPNNYTLSSVCFSPQTDPLPPADSSACVVQSFMGYFGDSLKGVSEDTWARNLNQCATTPAACLPGSGMPMNPKLVLGKIPASVSDVGHDEVDASEGADGEEIRADLARALVITYVVRNSLDEEVIARAEEWERTLQAFLIELADPMGHAHLALGLELAYSTGVSLEEEINKSTNTDVPIVVMSYLVMFLYISINLGSSGAGLLKSAGRGTLLIGQALLALVEKISLPSGSARNSGRARAGSITSITGSTAEMGAYFRRQLLVDSKFLLGQYHFSAIC